MLRVNNLSGFGRIAAGGNFDADAQAFFTAAGITDGTQKDAVNDLVVTLKADGIWADCNAIYPFVGGSASSHAVNLKQPGTYDITWSGTVTHDANGITPNGTNGYGDTGLTPSTSLTLNDVHLSIYCRSTADGTYADIGAYNFNTNSNRLTLNVRRADIAEFQCHGAGGTNQASATNNTSAAGFWIGSRRSATDAEMYKNNASFATQTGTQDGALVPRSIYIGAVNFAFVDGPAEFSNRNYAFASIGAGLTGTQAGNFNTAVTAYQTALSRNV